LTEPPAFSIAANAVFEAAATSKASLAVSVPLPSSLIPSRGFEQTPASISAARVTGLSAPSLPASTAACIRSRLTSL
jgi:hypothetical protein